MEGRKQFGSSSSETSSFTSELFGSNDLHKSSASGIFDSIFSPSSKVFGRESLRSAMNGKTATEGSNSKIDTQEYISKGNDGETQNKTNKDMSYIYQEQRVQPCHLSSSIYYGGQDVYSRPQSARDSGLNTMYKKDGGEDDSGSASRGNWWQGKTYIV
ncbi:plant/T7H20-70 protein [Medicago truncatula]|uniref:Plant/T7H20-70 protein n=1 Tax=Medicago truncatula TaxID=3880 RepID=A0A072U1L2_MEDTR|nr:plant/T7H20-70 protein [Medicago truncatula]